MNNQFSSWPSFTEEEANYVQKILLSNKNTLDNKLIRLKVLAPDTRQKIFASIPIEMEKLKINSPYLDEVAVDGGLAYLG